MTKQVGGQEPQERIAELQATIAEIYYRYLDLNRRKFSNARLGYDPSFTAIGELCSSANVPLDTDRLEKIR